MNDLKIAGNLTKNETRHQSGFQKMVGKTGFEPATPWSQTRDKDLRFTPDVTFEIVLHSLFASDPKRKKLLLISKLIIIPLRRGNNLVDFLEKES